MNTFKYFTIILLSSLFVFNACTSDTNTNEEKSPKPVTLDQLDGLWKLTSAVRDGVKTTSLEGTFIKISGENMFCNFTGEDVNSEFIFKDKEIKQDAQTYTIKEFSDNKMVLSTSLMDFNFDLTFTKAQE